jgi:hypothetical protein
MAGILPEMGEALINIFGSLFGIFGIPILPGMVPETLKGACLGAAGYGADWYKTLGKVFKNFFELGFF